MEENEIMYYKLNSVMYYRIDGNKIVSIFITQKGYVSIDSSMKMREWYMEKENLMNTIEQIDKQEFDKVVKKGINKLINIL